MKHCANCKLGTLTSPPSPGGESDGVYCRSKEVAQEQNSLDEYNEYGFVNLWAIEVIDDTAECEYWQGTTS